ncbi:polymerase [Wenzhou Crab Virus 3]|uniref:RNA-directed RNA polymerase n=1 Tax=Wenzhou Crab Virus 3 TaxID=1608093 RepID=A0A0B5KRB3_9VIRU|nr:polymerase [Wenzhou Crab Virus 3]AJG39066.1 polymerase [Wenzhou Crab Virus 3]
MSQIKTLKLKNAIHYKSYHHEFIKFNEGSLQFFLDETGLDRSAVSMSAINVYAGSASVAWFFSNTFVLNDKFAQVSGLKDVHRCQNLCSRLSSMMIKYICHTNSSWIKEQYQMASDLSVAKFSTFSGKVLQLMTYVLWVSSLRKVCKTRRGSYTFTWSQDLKYAKLGTLHIISIDQSVYVLTLTLLQELVQKIEEWACVLTIIHFQSHRWINLTEKFIISYLNDQAKVVTSHFRSTDYLDSQLPFSFIKSLEGIVVGVVISKADSMTSYKNENYLERMRTIIYDEFDSMATLMDIDRLITDLRKWSLEELVELTGCTKLIGYPGVDIREGVKTLLKHSQGKIDPDPDLITLHRGIIIKDFVLNFHYKHNRFPLLTFDDPETMRLWMELTSDVDEIPSQQVEEIPLEDWGGAHIEKAAEFDQFTSILPLIKDTATCPLVSDLDILISQPLLHQEYEEFDDYVFASSALKGAPRLLQTILQDSGVFQSYRDYIKAWCNDGYPFDNQLFSDYCIIKLTGKEKEMKPSARLFGASPFPERCRRVSQLYNTFSYLEKYVPGQLLSCGQFKSSLKLFNSTLKRFALPQFHIVNINWDFSKWNNTMREQFVDDTVGVHLDEFFGTHIYRDTMKFYQAATFFTSEWDTDGQHVLKWKGQEGGIEGLNQAEWTLSCLGMVKLCLHEMDLKGDVFIKGDDCRITLEIPKNEVADHDLTEHVEMIVEDLSLRLNRFNMISKPLEVFHSVNIVTASKQFQFNNIMLPSILKKGAKLMSMEDNQLDVMSSRLSSICSAGYNMCSVSVTPLLCWLTTLWWISLECLLNLKVEGFSEDQLLALLLWPQPLGGPGIHNICHFLMRGINDHLTSFTSFLKYCLSEPQYSSIGLLLLNILNIPHKPTMQLKYLIGGMYSLNVDIPINGSSVFRSEAKKILQTYTINEELTELVSSQTESEGLRILDYLFQFKPLNLKLIKLIYDNSYYKMMDELIQLFEVPETLFLLIPIHKRRTEIKRIVRRIGRAESNLAQFWKTTLILPYDGMILEQMIRENCPTRSAKILRKESWGSELGEITYACPVDSFVFSAVDEEATVSAEIGIKYHNTYPDDKLYLGCDHHPNLLYSASTTRVPFLGKETSSKVGFSLIDLRRKNAVFSRLKNLLIAACIAHPLSTKLRDVCYLLIQQFIPLELSDLEILTPSLTGAGISHRLTTRDFDKVNSPNYRANSYMYWTKNYDSAKVLRYAIAQDCNMNIMIRFIFDLSVLIMAQDFNLNQDAHLYQVLRPHFSDQGNNPLFSLGEFEFPVCHDCFYPVQDMAVDGPDECLQLEKKIFPQIAASEDDIDYLKREINVANEKKFFGYHLHPLSHDSKYMVNIGCGLLRRFTEIGGAMYQRTLDSKIKISAPKDVLIALSQIAGMESLNQMSSALLTKLPMSCFIMELLRCFISTLDLDDSTMVRDPDSLVLVECLFETRSHSSFLDQFLLVLGVPKSDLTTPLSLALINPGTYQQVLIEAIRKAPKLSAYITSCLSQSFIVRTGEDSEKIQVLYQMEVIKRARLKILQMGRLPSRDDCSFIHQECNKEDIELRLQLKATDLKYFKCQSMATHHTISLLITDRLVPHGWMCKTSAKCHSVNSYIALPDFIPTVIMTNYILEVNMANTSTVVKGLGSAEWNHNVEELKPPRYFLNLKTVRCYMPLVKEHELCTDFSPWVYRIYGTTSTSSTKLLYALRNLGVSQTDLRSAWCFADGTGGFASCLARFSRNCTVCYSSLSNDSDQRIPDFMPDSIFLSDEEKSRVYKSRMEPMDFLSQQNLTAMCSEFKNVTHHPRPSFLCCDIDTDDQKVITQYRWLLKHQYIGSGMMGFLKCFKTQDIKSFLDDINEENLGWLLLRPEGTSNSSNEFYLVINQNLKRNESSDQMIMEPASRRHLSNDSLRFLISPAAIVKQNSIIFKSGYSLNQMYPLWEGQLLQLSRKIKKGKIMRFGRSRMSGLGGSRVTLEHLVGYISLKVFFSLKEEIPVIPTRAALWNYIKNNSDLLRMTSLGSNMDDVRAFFATNDDLVPKISSRDCSVDEFINHYGEQAIISFIQLLSYFINDGA